MTFSVRIWGGVWLLLGSLWLSGCLPSAHSQLEEEKEPHFLAGKSRVSTMDYRGAIECFEKALELNPQSGSAHFELGWLFDQKESDPAAAIYHYERYLELRAAAENGEMVKTRILACKQELARTVSLGPVNQAVQRELEQLTAQKKSLEATNKLLTEEIEKLRAWYAATTRVTAPTSPSGPTVVVARAYGAPNSGTTARLTPTPGLPEAGRTAVSSPGPYRTHTVQRGDTATAIARRYGVKLSALLAANPSLDPRRLRVGQMLNIPAS
jgi:tetratricopeptide (TPR) repeat protein